MRWREVSMCEAVQFMQGRTLAENPTDEQRLVEPYDVSCPARVAFTDGSVVLASSNVSGPYSVVTPDIDPNEPDFWIGEP